MERLLNRVILDQNGCWLFDGASSDGYGRVKHEGRTAYAHRLSYQHFREEIPAGLSIDHLCRRRNCVNPWHLEAVTQAENVRRGHAPNVLRSQANVCGRGHSLLDAYVNKMGCRNCRTCRNAAAARYRARKRETVKATKGKGF